MRRPAGFPCRVMTISSDSAIRRKRDKSSLTSASATWRIRRAVLGEPARGFDFRDDREDFDGFGRDIIENSHLPDPEPMLRLAQAAQPLDRPVRRRTKQIVDQLQRYALPVENGL